MLLAQQLRNLVYAWTEVFARSEECERFLLENECKAFVPMQEAYLQFAERSEDVELHRRYGRETARRAAMPHSLLRDEPAEVRDRWYRPPLWEQGRTVLARQAGYPTVDAWIAALNPTAMELNPDPVMRSMWAKLGATDMPLHQATSLHSEAAFARARTVLAQEAAQFVACDPGPLLPERRLLAATELATCCLTHLGFKPAKTRLRSYVAFDLDISDDLVLRWSLGERRPNFLLGYLDNCRPSLDLRARSMTKRAVDSASPGECLEITYVHLIHGFDAVYGRGRSEREMKAVFRAHSLVVEWLLPSLLRAVREHVSNPA